MDFKNYITLFITIFISSFHYSQNVQTSSVYSSQELIEDILIQSNCIKNVKVTNVVGGNFSGNEQSYGYFNASDTSFPFNEGIVLSTGKLSNVGGPNDDLSDDDASYWDGDSDLEYILNESNTTNATIIEFEFTAIANQISFNYIFASEEYREGESSTCNYSDLFGFLIKNKRDRDFTNIAVIPNTNTPVKVTTVHPAIPNGCDAQNEAYFGSWNDDYAVINFNGQTKVLAAVADVQPNEIYQVKLVIADEQNYRYDSAVFLEAGSFKSNINLGVGRLLATENPLCFGEILNVNAQAIDLNSTFKWYFNNVEIQNQNSSQFSITEPGNYRVEVIDGNGCISEGELTVEYAEEIVTTPSTLNSCDIDNDGLTFFDLELAADLLTSSNPKLKVNNYYLTETNALNNQNSIDKTVPFYNTQPNQTIYARVENQYNCFEIEELKLQATNNILSFNEWNICDLDNDGFGGVDLNEIRAVITNEYPNSKSINFFESLQHAANNNSKLQDNYTNITANKQDIYVKVEDTYCEIIAAITLLVNKKPVLQHNEELTYCLNNYPNPIVLNAGIETSFFEIERFSWEKDGVNLNLNKEVIEINESGLYKVTVIDKNGCSESRTIEVSTSETAKNISIQIENKGKTSDLVVIADGIGSYSFALDQGTFQSNPNFYNVTPGLHTIYISDLSGCGIVTKEITVFGYPTFFSPNNDGINDTWFPIGLNTLQNSATSIQIYNRFGKLIIQLNTNSIGWDGNLNGVKLPSSDYWFLIQLNNGEQIKGNFTLIR